MPATPESSWRPLRMYSYKTPSPRSCYSDLTEAGALSHQTKSSGLMDVLEQVSELTMEDENFKGETDIQTPNALNSRPTYRPASMLDDFSGRKPSPFLSCRQPVRNSSSTPCKLSTAPPLPSSPDLSAGGDFWTIAPHFSPVGSSHTIDIGPLLRRRHMQLEDEGDGDEMMLSPEALPPSAPPPTPQVAALPPPMPWFETPEQEPRKKIGLNHSLQMRKGPFSFP